MEALLRWMHPDRGLLPPTELLLRSEQAGTMLALTSAVLDLALEQLARWIEQGHRLRMSVNVPPDVMASKGFDRVVGKALSRHGVPGELLRLELTEQHALASWSDLDRALSELAQLGVSCSLDDLGSASSTLHRLAALSFAEVKLDLALVQGIETSARQRECVASTIGMAHRLGMHVVAEGVEEQATLEVLVELGCDAVQGFLFARPLPGIEVQLTPFDKVIHSDDYQAAPSISHDRYAEPLVVGIGGRRGLRRSVIAACGYVTIYLLWQVLRGPGWGSQALVGDLLLGAVNGWAAVATWRAGNRARSVPRLRRGWRVISAGLTAYLVGLGIWTWYEIGLKQVPYPGLADVAYLSFYPLMMAGVLMLSAGNLSRGVRAALSLDVAIVTVGASAVVWYFVLGATAAAGGDALTVAVSIAYPVADIILVLAASVALLRGALTSSRLSLTILLGCLITFVVTDLVYSWLILHATYHGGDLLGTGWIAALAAMAVAGSAQGHPGVVVERRSAPRSHGAAGVTALAVTVSCALLLAAGANQQFYPLGGLILGAVALTVLVSLRQRVALQAHARLAVAYRKVASTDVLTGLLSRRALLEEAENLFAAAQQRDRALSILMIDLDHFKTINDTFGHAAGDQVLIKVAEACRRALPQAVIGRYGGDELVAVLAGTELSRACSLSDGLAQILRDAAPVSDAPTQAVTLSVGVASARGRRDLDAVLAAADLALYEAKAAGRSCTRSSSLIPAPR